MSSSDPTSSDDVLRAAFGQGRQPEDNYLTRRARHGGMRNRAARREAAPPPAEPFRIQWDDTLIWRTRNDTCPIDQMEDKYLYGTLCWVVRNGFALFLEYVPNPRGNSEEWDTAHIAWLRERPLFRALVRETVRRQFTYPEDVFRYLKRYVLDRDNTLDGYKPWQDPQHAEQAVVLRPLANMPLLTPEVEYGKSLRAFTLEKE